MLPVVVAPSTSFSTATPAKATGDLSFLGGQASDLPKQHVNNPGDFLALLARLAPAQAAVPHLAQPGIEGGGSPPSQKNSNKAKDQELNVVLIAAFISTLPPTPLNAMQAAEVAKTQFEGLETKQLAGATSHADLSVPKPAPAAVDELIPTPVSNSAPELSEGMAENALPPLTPREPLHAADVAAPAPPTRPQETNTTNVPLQQEVPAAVSQAGSRSTASLAIVADATLPTGAGVDAAQAAARTPDRPVSSQPTALGGDLANAVVAPYAAPGKSAPASVSAPAPVEQIREQISAHVDQLRQVGRVEVQLDLHPPELGRVQLHLAMEDGHMNVRMLVQDDAVKRLINLQLEPLRARFADMGVRVGQFDVRRDDSSPDQNQQPASESSVQAIQTAKNGPARLRKVYAPLAKSAALVDVIA